MEFIFQGKKHYLRFVADGVNGEYWKINSKLGVKFLFAHYMDNFDTLAKLKKSKYYKKVKNEFDMQSKVWEKYPHLTSQPIEIVFIQKEESWMAGIVMEHIRGKSLLDIMGIEEADWQYYDVSPCWVKGRLVKMKKSTKVPMVNQMLDKYLRKAKVNHRDLHWGNIIITPKKEIKVIDFGDAESFL